VTDVLIWGSCVSRDAFELPEAATLHLVDYYARSSAASAFGSAPVPDAHSRSLASTFQRRQVQRDHAKSLAGRLGNGDWHILLVDFIDERFPLLRLADGRIVTVSAELARCMGPAPAGSRKVRPFGDEHFQLWEAGWSRFTGTLAAAGRLGGVRLNCARWCRADDRGASFGGHYAPADIEAANRHLTRLYARVARDLEPGQLLQLPEDGYVARSDHGWGPAPFHYADSSYRDILALLIRSME
jgi:hypothetical protein